MKDNKTYIDKVRYIENQLNGTYMKDLGDNILSAYDILYNNVIDGEDLEDLYFEIDATIERLPLVSERYKMLFDTVISYEGIQILSYLDKSSYNISEACSKFIDGDYSTTNANIIGALVAYMIMRTSIRLKRDEELLSIIPSMLAEEFNYTGNIYRGSKHVVSGSGRLESFSKDSNVAKYFSDTIMFKYTNTGFDMRLFIEYIMSLPIDEYFRDIIRPYSFEEEVLDTIKGCTPL